MILSRFFGLIYFSYIAYCTEIEIAIYLFSNYSLAIL